VIEGGTICNTAAPIMTDDCEALVACDPHHLDERGSQLSLRHGSMTIAVIRAIATSVARQVCSNDCEVRRKKWSDCMPH
jgi:hypothetical protein